VTRRSVECDAWSTSARLTLAFFGVLVGGTAAWLAWRLIDWAR
jgi:hypothetical protein